MRISDWSSDVCSSDLICGQGTAPAAATIARYRELGLDMVPGSGPLAAAIPGAFDAWMKMLQDHGTMRPREVLEYVIATAEHGTALAAGISDPLTAVKDASAAEWETTGKVWGRRG